MVLTEFSGERSNEAALSGSKEWVDEREVLYEAKLAVEGKKLAWAGVAVLALWFAAGAFLCFRSSDFPENIILFILLFLGGGIASCWFGRHMVRQVFRLRLNPGLYRISIDDYGLYVHSDDPNSTGSFSVPATNLKYLVKRTIKNADSEDQEYFVETKSGERHEIEPLFTNYNLNAMEVFAEIVERFHWVEIVEEEVRR